MNDGYNGIFIDIITIMIIDDNLSEQENNTSNSTANSSTTTTNLNNTPDKSIDPIVKYLLISLSIIGIGVALVFIKKFKFNPKNIVGNSKEDITD